MFTTPLGRFDARFDKKLHMVFPKCLWIRDSVNGEHFHHPNTK